MLFAEVMSVNTIRSVRFRCSRVRQNAGILTARPRSGERGYESTVRNL